MQTSKLAILPSLIRFPMLALFCLLLVDVTAPSKASAGNVPAGDTAVDGAASGVDGSFAPAEADGASGGVTVTPAAVSGSVSNSLLSLQRTQSITSVTGAELTMSPAQLSVITAAFSATGGDIQPALTALSNQLSAELGGDVAVDVSVVSSSANNLISAISAANTLINSLTSVQLEAAMESPSFMAVRQVLAAAADTTENAEGGEVAEGGGNAGLPILSLAR